MRISSSDDHHVDGDMIDDISRNMDAADRVEKEALALRQLRVNYNEYNSSLFGGAMRQPIFAFTDAKQRLGGWRSATRMLDMSRELIWRTGWGQVLEILKHEMAHQYVDEVLALRDNTIEIEPAHGPTFRQVCAARGIDARATSDVDERDVSDSSVDDPSDDEARVAKRVRSLLSLAQSDNEHEARSAARLAQRMMLTHNIKIASDTNVGSDQLGRIYTYRYLGVACGRVYEWQRVLAAILEQHYFVSVIWIPVWQVAKAKRGTVLEACGTLSNIEMASYVHAFLARSAASLWDAHCVGKRMPGRLRYYAGIMSGFREQLDVQEQAQQAEGLIWQGDPDINCYLRKRHPYVRITRRAAARRDGAFSAGQQAGRSIILNKGISGTISSGIRGLLT